MLAHRHRSSGRFALAAGLAVALLVPALAPADHPTRTGWPGDPAESPRAHPPNDPDFDEAEPPHESFPAGCRLAPSSEVEHPVLDCPTIFDEQYELFGFAPEYTKTSAFNRDGTPQIAGASVDRAWQVTTGEPDATIGIVDTGIRWESRELDAKVFLNRGELPPPFGAPADADVHDANGDGAFTVVDYCPGAPASFECPIAEARHPGTGAPIADTNANGRLDGQDLIRTLSDGVDDDGNGYTDDISGWDFFDDDNDPGDASSYGSANNHGSGRAEEAAAETNNGLEGSGVCPDCPLMFLRVWDTFIPPVDNFAQATIYAADMGAVATENAIGTLGASDFGADATKYAWDKGTLPVIVSSDLNTAHHDYPANYAPILWVNGVVADLEGSDGGVQPRTYFRQANLTQYGGHAHVAIGGDTGSQATGKAAGVAGLVASRGLELAHAGFLDEPLSPAEIKQLITMSADDVDAPETLGYGVPDPAQPGWDQFFGYGRINARSAVDALGDPARNLPVRIPPTALVDSPSWWTIVDPSSDHLDIEGRVSNTRHPGAWRYTVEIAHGLEPMEGEYVEVEEVSIPQKRVEKGQLARIDVDDIKALFPPLTDFGAPPRDPNQFVFTVRVRALGTNGEGEEIRGEDRRAYFIHRDRALRDGWPKALEHGAESGAKLADLDGNGTLEIILATTNGELHAYKADGTELKGFPFQGDPSPLLAAHGDAPGIRKLKARPLPFITPAVGDVDADGETEIVVLDGGGRLYQLDGDGNRERSFLAIDPALSAPALRSKQNPVATGVLAAPVLSNLDDDDALEIVVAAFDGRVYVWNDDGTLRPGFPRLLQDPDPGGPATDPKIISVPAVGDIDGDGDEEIVAATNEYRDPVNDALTAEFWQSFLERVTDVEDGIGAPGAFGGLATDLLGTLGGSSRIYAVHADGSSVDGWPVALDGLLIDVLPLIGPGFTPALADLDGDGDAEVVTGVTTSNLYAFDGDGSVFREFSSSNFGLGSDAVDRSVALNLFEYPAIGDLTGDGAPEVVKGGISLAVAVNLVLTGQNVPFDHLVQAWDTGTGSYLPAFPRKVEDWMLLFTPAIADVGAPGTGDDPLDHAEALVGTGLHMLHAFGQTGLEPAGWPKMTGGWMVATPAVGDLDGDGDVEVVGSTREGWVFVWETDGAASANSEWWSFHHDEWNTGRYGFDPR